MGKNCGGLVSVRPSWKFPKLNKGRKFSVEIYYVGTRLQMACRNLGMLGQMSGKLLGHGKLA